MMMTGKRGERGKQGRKRDRQSERERERERASIITARPSESFCSRVVFELTPRQQRESDENPGCKRARNYKAGYGYQNAQCRMS